MCMCYLGCFSSINLNTTKWKPVFHFKGTAKAFFHRFKAFFTRNLLKTALGNDWFWFWWTRVLRPDKFYWEKGHLARSPMSWYLGLCLWAAAELGLEGLSFTPSLGLRNSPYSNTNQIQIQYKPKSNILRSVLFYPAQTQVYYPQKAITAYMRF